MNEIFLDRGFAAAWQGRDPFEAAFALSGEEFRHVKSRRTFRVEMDGQGCFVKLHRGIGWREIFKDLLQGKRPVLGASNEYRAIRRLDELNVPTMLPRAYGSRGWNPARIQSFLVTAELAGMVSLEDHCRDWRTAPPPVTERVALTCRLARMLRRMHRGGVNHRDCYLCHFLLRQGEKPELHVIDLHRAQIRRRTPRRYLIKDLAGIWFSAMDAGMTRRDQLRFIRVYEAKKFSQLPPERQYFWQCVDRTARKLYRRVHGRQPEFV